MVNTKRRRDVTRIRGPVVRKLSGHGYFGDTWKVEGYFQGIHHNGLSFIIKQDGRAHVDFIPIKMICDKSLHNLKRLEKGDKFITYCPNHLPRQRISYLGPQTNKGVTNARQNKRRYILIHIPD